LFNLLTGVRQTTGNWPGVTVDRKEGHFDLNGIRTTVIDLPGIYSMDAASIDEQITRDYLLSHDAQLIVNILDASNLERNLYLTMQILEMGIPMVIALNMMDVARKRGIELDIDKLSERLGWPVVPIVAVTGEGLEELKRQVKRISSAQNISEFQVVHEDTVEQAITDLKSSLEGKCERTDCRWLALKLLENDKDALSLAGESVRAKIGHWQKVIAERTGEDADMHIADARYSHAHAIASRVTKQQGKVGRTMTDRIDKVVLDRIFGIPVFLAVMYFMFMFTINIGGAFIDFFDGVAGAFLVDGLGHWMTAMGLPQWLVVLLANGVGGGIQVVATFIPIITCLYLILSILEDTGYMARAAFVMDRFMRSIGLPGKAFVPMIVGFGCNVPAVMATRTLENPRERKLTILMNPFMSCGARLPVYALFAAAFFPTHGQNLVFGLYLIGIGIAVLTGMIMKRTLLAGQSTGFLMELPPYHLPTLRGVALRTWDRVKLFIKEAGKIIIAMVLVLNILNSIGADGSFGNEDSENSALSVMGKSITPVFAPMGIRDENWPATVGIFTGVLAKEAVVGTLDSLYTELAEQERGASDKDDGFELLPALLAAASTVPANLAALSELLLDPLGLNIAEVSDVQTAAEAQEVNAGVFGAMASRFDGRVGAFAYLLFILLYFPCVATVGAIARETGRSWAAFVALWTTGVAYTTATLFYQIATFTQHPTSAAAWIAGLSLLMVVVFTVLRVWGGRVVRPEVSVTRVGA
jgi:ferrous iron transport protein B